ncbi:hypothetical protein GCM10023320_79660 [Pseudonocardia adelaidensis]|uniref:Uncharacterized protein n=1 Tax=Pseudonocardia adelaidensis TaxID=648754 RepID=A0ABP9P6J7_9PSEU
MPVENRQPDCAGLPHCDPFSACVVPRACTAGTYTTLHQNPPISVRARIPLILPIGRRTPAADRAVVRARRGAQEGSGAPPFARYSFFGGVTLSE